MTVGTDNQLSHAERVAYIRLCGWYTCWNYGVPMFTDGTIAILVNLSPDAKGSPNVTEYALGKGDTIPLWAGGEGKQNGDTNAAMWNEVGQVANFFNYLEYQNDRRNCGEGSLPRAAWGGAYG